MQHTNNMEAEQKPRVSDGKLTSFTLLVTANCNLRCDYCYTPKHPRQMDRETADRSIDFMFAESDPASPLSVTYFGGEPLMAPATIEYICKQVLKRAEAEKREVSFSMTTNGTLVDQRNTELIQTYDIKTKISIDGAGTAQDLHRKQADGSGSFSLILKHIDNIRSLPGLTVRMTVTPDTARHLVQSVQWLSDNGFRHVFFTPVVEADWDERSLATLYDAYHELSPYQKRNDNGMQVSNLQRDYSRLRKGSKREYGCGAAVSMAAIDPRGHLYPCHRFAGYFAHTDDCRIGDVRNGFNQEKRNYYIETNRTENFSGCGAGLFPDSTPSSEGTCLACSLFPVCHASCIAVNRFMTGKPYAPSPVNRILAQISASTSLACCSTDNDTLLTNHSNSNAGGTE